ncbi:hypothetical protein [Chitinophaga silvatica]|nr:hypothetical protein [Chitinophaga silvatica]
MKECVSQDGFIYGIKETKGISRHLIENVYFHDDALEVQLFNKNGDQFTLSENGWLATAIGIKESRKGFGNGIIPTMDIADPLGNTQTITAEVKYYGGVIQLHRLLKYLSNCPNWDIASERRNKMELKKIFLRLKNEKDINITLFINPDEDFLIRLYFENNIFKMHYCIIEGDLYLGVKYKDEHDFESNDFYEFMHKVYELFPNIEIQLRKD